PTRRLVRPSGTPVRAGPARPTPRAPRRGRPVVVHNQRRDRLLTPRLGLDRPVDDPAQVEDGDLHDHHQPDQLPHDDCSLPPVFPSQPATAASSSPRTSSRPSASYWVTSSVALSRSRSTPRVVATRTGRPASTS